MDAAILEAYNASREPTPKSFPSLCYAPHTSLYFNTQGDVRVCCHNWAFPAGNIARQTIAEIWAGDAIKKIRRSLECGSFAQGCHYCEWQLATRSFVNISTRKWDWHPVESRDPEWPLQMEFSISNTCNLECIMCNGMSSSAIRAHREKLPPVHNPYSDAFFSELRAYLPRLRKASFLGGEPFLQAECSRIWNMLIEDGIQLPCHVTTNGTQYNALIEKFLERIPFSFSISLDGYRKKTIESIRVNAKYDVLMRNVNRFRNYARERNQHFGLTYCLMRPNWEEFGDFCLFADALECSVFVNAVRKPPELSLYTLSPAELGRIADSMEAQADRVVPLLGRNRAIWTGEVARLRARSSGQSPMVDNVKIRGFGA